MIKSTSDLNERAQRLIGQGWLPQAEPESTWGGYGTFEPCHLCRDPILPSEVEYEVRYGTAAYRFHFACHTAWLNGRGCKRV